MNALEKSKLHKKQPVTFTKVLKTEGVWKPFSPAYAQYRLFTIKAFGKFMYFWTDAKSLCIYSIERDNSFRTMRYVQDTITNPHEFLVTFSEDLEKKKQAELYPKKKKKALYKVMLNQQGMIQDLNQIF